MNAEQLIQYVVCQKETWVVSLLTLILINFIIFYFFVCDTFYCSVINVSSKVLCSFCVTNCQTNFPLPNCQKTYVSIQILPFSLSLDVALRVFCLFICFCHWFQPSMQYRNTSLCFALFPCQLLILNIFHKLIYHFQTLWIISSSFIHYLLYMSKWNVHLVVDF